MADVMVQCEGSIFLLTPISGEARSWLRDNVQPDAQWFGPALVVEHRYVEDLVEGLRCEGFNVEVSR